MIDDDIQIIEEDKELQEIGLELMFTAPEKWSHKDGVTAIELSRKLNIKMNIVKKKLKLLKEKEIVRCIGINPKYWVFDNYKFQRMDETDPVYMTLCCFDNVDFDKYFQY